MIDNGNDIHLRGPWAKLAAALMLAAMLAGAGLVIRMDARLTVLEEKHVALSARLEREREGISGSWSMLTEANKRLGEIEQRLAGIEGRLIERSGR